MNNQKFSVEISFFDLNLILGTLTTFVIQNRGLENDQIINFFSTVCPSCNHKEINSVIMTFGLMLFQLKKSHRPLQEGDLFSVNKEQFLQDFRCNSCTHNMIMVHFNNLSEDEVEKFKLFFKNY